MHIAKLITSSWIWS